MPLRFWGADIGTFSRRCQSREEEEAEEKDSGIVDERYH
jgi:hypothetical protein